MKRLLFLSGFLGFCLSALADTLVFTSNRSGEQLARSLKYLADPTGVYTYAKIKALEKHLPFAPVDQTVPDYGFVEGNLWFTFTLKNDTKESVFLVVNYPFLKELVLYSSDFPKGMTMGESFKFSHRDILINNYNFKLPLAPGETKQFHLKVNSDYILVLPFQLYGLKQLAEEKHITDMLQGLYFGVVLAMIFYNLFLYFSVKDSTYLWYVVYCVFIGLLNGLIQELGFEFLYPDWPIVHQYTEMVPSITGLAATIFSYKFLNIRQNQPKLVYFLGFPAFVLILAVLLGFMGLRIYSSYAMLIGSLMLPAFLFLSGLYTYKNGFKPAFFYLVAWGCFLSMAMVYLLSSVTILPYNDFTVNAMEYGSGAEMVLLSLALASKINFYKAEAERAQRHMLESEKRVKNELEMLVAVRTAEIVKTQEKLNEVIQELQAVNSNLEDIVSFRTEELKRTNNELKVAMTELDTFMYRSAHDLRGPVLRMMGLIQLVQKKALNGNSQEFLHWLNDNTVHMNRILDKFSMINKLNMGSEVQSFLPFEVVKEVVGVFSTDLSERNIKLALEGGKTAVSLDRDAFYDIVYVSLENAINYCRQEHGVVNQIYIQVMLKSNFLEYSIWDNGIGISEQVKDKIFDMYFRGTEQSKGNGLGLYVTRKAMEKLNGKILIESEEGQYTHFRFEIPMNL